MIYNLTRRCSSSAVRNETLAEDPGCAVQRGVCRKKAIYLVGFKGIPDGGDGTSIQITAHDEEAFWGETPVVELSAGVVGGIELRHIGRSPVLFVLDLSIYLNHPP